MHGIGVLFLDIPIWHLQEGLVRRLKECICISIQAVAIYFLEKRAVFNHHSLVGSILDLTDRLHRQISRPSLLDLAKRFQIEI